MENGRCSRGLLRAYPPPSVRFPTLGKGEGRGWEQGAHPSPTPGAGLSLESLPTAGYHPLSTHSPITNPEAQSLSQTRTEAGVGGGRSRGTRPGARESWCAGLGGLILIVVQTLPCPPAYVCPFWALLPQASFSITLFYFSKSRSV